MNTNIIELREANANTKNNLGDYNITLREKLLLEEGDELTVKSCYIDTRSNNNEDNRIKIDETNDKYDMNHIIYFMRYSKYVLSYKVPQAGQPKNILELTQYQFQQGVPKDTNGIDLQMLIATPKAPEGEYVPVSFSDTKKHGKPTLTNWDGSPLSLHYLSDKTEFSQDDFDGCWDETNFNKLDNAGYTLYGPDPKDRDDYPPFADDCLHGTATQVTNGDAYHPVEFNVQFDIPHGLYEPDALAKFITDRLSATKFAGTAQNIQTDNKIKFTEFGVSRGTPNNEVTTYPTKTPYFTSIKQLQTDNNFGLQGEAEFYFMREDTLSKFTVNRASAINFIVGASDVALTFDDTLNKFVFQSLHTPIVLSDDSEGIVFDTDGNPNTFIPADSHSGIAFTGFGKDNTTQVTKLFQQNMGFDNSLFARVEGQNPRNYGPDQGGGTGTENNVIASQVSMFQGHQITGALISTDAFFSKKHNQPAAGANPAEGYYRQFPMAKAEITTLNVNFIVGEKTLVQTPGELSNAYFLLEIGGLPTQTISYGSKDEGAHQQTIKSIVGRYYQTSDYTQDSGAGSITYIHKGQPTFINNLSVRILSPDGTLSTEIGDDNTVFLELIKRIQLPQEK